MPLLAQVRVDPGARFASVTRALDAIDASRFLGFLGVGENPRAPKGLSHACFTAAGGAEANEKAFRLARLHTQATGTRRRVLAFESGFHGRTHISLMAACYRRASTMSRTSADHEKSGAPPPSPVSGL